MKNQIYSVSGLWDFALRGPSKSLNRVQLKNKIFNFFLILLVPIPNLYNQWFQIQSRMPPLTSVTNFLFKDQISTLSTKHSNANNTSILGLKTRIYSSCYIWGWQLDPGVSLWQVPVFLKINESKFWLATYVKHWKNG